MVVLFYIVTLACFFTAALVTSSPTARPSPTSATTSGGSGRSSLASSSPPACPSWSTASVSSSPITAAFVGISEKLIRMPSRPDRPTAIFPFAPNAVAHRFHRLLPRWPCRRGSDGCLPQRDHHASPLPASASSPAAPAASAATPTVVGAAPCWAPSSSASFFALVRWSCTRPSPPGNRWRFLNVDYNIVGSIIYGIGSIFA